MQKTTLYLPADLKLRLTQESRRTGRPQAEIVRRALEAYLGRTPRPLPKSIGLGSDPELSGVDVDDWLQDHWRFR